MTECKNLDPTAFGLFLVAALSLPLALVFLDLFTLPPSFDLAACFPFIGLVILFVAYLAYKAESQFGFTVFGLVGTAIALTGLGMGYEGALVFAIIFLLTIIWSLIAKTPKLLTLILVTTTVVFLCVALAGMFDMDLNTVTGIFALLNFIFALYLAFALALENKIPIF
jgi:hypothetical protein